MDPHNNRTLRMLGLTAIVCAALALGLSFLVGCTVTPSIVAAPKSPEYHGNSANGGLIDLGPGGKGPAHVDAEWVAEYDRLVSIYGKTNIPRVKKGDGLTALPDGTYLVDLEHLSDKNVFATEERSRIKP